ncbi:MAG TPA: hypothetical protein VFF29_05260 [Bacteroidota bacterium]|nr:hypothetical protein [Bacteroidota bacterium]
MNRMWKMFSGETIFLSLILLIFVSNSCTQYEYSSPLPGILEIRLKTISDTARIKFSPLNNFVLKITAVEAVREDQARVSIYEDIKALGRTTSIYNTLDYRARDSNLVIGQGYVPPGNYIGVNLLIEPGSVAILDGYRRIPVVKSESFDALLRFRRPFTVSELNTTFINVAIDLDTSLVQGADIYDFNPYYYISSIK